MELLKRFVEWFRYKLHLTDWKRKEFVISYYTKRGAEAELILKSGTLEAVPIESEQQEVFIAKIEEVRGRAVAGKE